MPTSLWRDGTYGLPLLLKPSLVWTGSLMWCCLSPSPACKDGVAEASASWNLHATPLAHTLPAGSTSVMRLFRTTLDTTMRRKRYGRGAPVSFGAPPSRSSLLSTSCRPRLDERTTGQPEAKRHSLRVRRKLRNNTEEVEAGRQLRSPP